MSFISRKPGQAVSYKYKLNSNYKEKQVSTSLNGVMLNKLSWVSFSDAKTTLLADFIRSFKNPNGIVDEIVIDPLNRDVEKKNTFDFVHRKKYYTKDTLSILQRKELEEIAEEYSIDPVKKMSSYVIKLIMEEQAKYKEATKTSEDFFDEEINVED